MSQNERPQRSSPTAIRFAVLACLCLLAALAYIDRGCLAVPKERVQTELGFDANAMAQVIFGFFLGYTLFQLPSGWLGDRWGTRRALTLFVILWSAATAWMAFANSFYDLWAAMFVNGMAQAGIFPCCVRTIARWFPETGKAVPNGLLGSFMSVGAALATALTGLLLKFTDWRDVFLVLALPGLACAVGFYWWFRNEPAEHSWVNDEELSLIRGITLGARRENSFTFRARGEESIAGRAHGDEVIAIRGVERARNVNDSSPALLLPGSPALSSVWPVLLRPTMLLICFQQFFRAAGYNFFFMYFTSLLQKTRGVADSDSGLWASLPLLGVVAGSTTGGLLLDRIYQLTGSKQLSRQGVAVAGLIACGALIVLAYGTHETLLTTALLTAAAFCAGLGGPAAYTVTIDLGGRHVATIFSTMNMAGNVGAMLLPLVVVALADEYSWNEALLLLAGLYFAAAGCWTLVKIETKADNRDRQPISSSQEKEKSE